MRLRRNAGESFGPRRRGTPSRVPVLVFRVGGGWGALGGLTQRGALLGVGCVWKHHGCTPLFRTDTEPELHSVSGYYCSVFPFICPDADKMRSTTSSGTSASTGMDTCAVRYSGRRRW